jgi:hypothetical protein
MITPWIRPVREALNRTSVAAIALATNPRTALCMRLADAATPPRSAFASSFSKRRLLCLGCSSMELNVITASAQGRPSASLLHVPEFLHLLNPVRSDFVRLFFLPPLPLLSLFYLPVVSPLFLSEQDPDPVDIEAAS